VKNVVQVHPLMPNSIEELEIWIARGMQVYNAMFSRISAEIDYRWDICRVIKVVRMK
jgi:hypothetical protein